MTRVGWKICSLNTSAWLDSSCITTQRVNSFGSMPRVPRLRASLQKAQSRFPRCAQGYLLTLWLPLLLFASFTRRGSWKVAEPH